MILLYETGVEMPSLPGDLEYIPYTPQHPEAAWFKAHQMLTALLSQHAGIVMEHVVSAPEPKANPSDSGEPTETVALATSAEPNPLHECLSNLLDAARAKDFKEAARRQSDGVQLIKTSGVEYFDEIGWISVCLSLRATCGELASIELLHDLSIANPENSKPLRALAQIARGFKEYEKAGELCVKAAQVESGNFDHRIRARKTGNLSRTLRHQPA